MDDKKAQVDPTTMFKKPHEVVERSDLSRDQKIQILRRWEYDLRELQVAEEEGMPAVNVEPVTLDAVLNALRALGEGTGVKRSAPTKQGGS